MKPPIFIELCAGTAALSLRLQGGAGAKPPVSRMGAKTGYADAILAVLGLYPGQGAESYLWCEPDDGVRGLLMAYAQPDVLRAAAKILRGWKDEEPRALWERLRAELKAGASVDGAEGVARWFTCGQWSFVRGDPESSYNAAVAEQDESTPTHYGSSALDVTKLARRLVGLPPLPPTFIARDGRAVTPEGVARVCMVLGCSMSGTEDRYSGWFTGQPPAACEWHGAAKIARLVAENGRDARGRPLAKAAGHPDVMAPRLERMAERTYPPTFIARDGRAVTPEEVARQWLLGAWSYEQGNTATGFCGPGDRRQDTRAVAVAVAVADLAAEWPPVTITADARTLTPPRLPEGVIVYMDPPYLDTTGYKHDLPREEVVKMARTWAAAGATVCISEAEPIPDLIAEGWHAVEISATREGHKRTFSKQQAEWLTLSRPPSFVPRETLGLFG